MSGGPFQIRSLRTDDFPQIRQIQALYAARYPEAVPLPAQGYHLPGFTGSANVLCAAEADGGLVGYASLNPALAAGGQTNLPHVIWAEIKVDPNCSQKEIALRSLFDCALDRAHQLVASYPQRSAQIVFQYFPFEDENVDFLFQQGFVHTESVFQLKRDLTQPIPIVLAPPGMQIYPWRMESEAEQRRYLEARNTAFPESPLDLEEWQYFMKSPLWEVGVCLAAFDGEDLAGSIILFWDEAQNEAEGKQIGSTEYIFVLPRWRGIGLGLYIISQGLLHLKKHGLLEAKLEVTATNSGALGLYTRLGYQITRESWFMAATL